MFVLRDFHARITHLAEAFREDGGKQRIIDWRVTRGTQDDWLAKENLDDEKLGVRLFHFDDAVLDRAAREATPPVSTKVEQTLSYLQRNLDRALKCKKSRMRSSVFFPEQEGPRVLLFRLRGLGKAKQQQNIGTKKT